MAAGASGRCALGARAVDKLNRLTLALINAADLRGSGNPGLNRVTSPGVDGAIGQRREIGELCAIQLGFFFCGHHLAPWPFTA